MIKMRSYSAELERLFSFLAEDQQDKATINSILYNILPIEKNGIEFDCLQQAIKDTILQKFANQGERIQKNISISINFKDELDKYNKGFSKAYGFKGLFVIYCSEQCYLNLKYLCNVAEFKYLISNGSFDENKIWIDTLDFVEYIASA